MPSRRAVLAAASTAFAASVAGCGQSGSDDPPAGTVRFVNRDDVPHDLRIAVTGIGTEPGDDQGSVSGDPEGVPGDQTFTATASLDPESTEEYESVFDVAVWHAVEFTVDGRPLNEDRGRVAFNPMPDGRERGRVLEGTVSTAGEIGWAVAATDNPGAFDG
jgi:hypothetical protein